MDDEHEEDAAAAVSPGDLAAVGAAVERFQRMRKSKRIHAALTAAAEVDLTQQALQLLSVAHDGLTATQLAEASNMDMAAVSRELVRLENAALLRREPGPDHHSSVVVRLTAEGTAARDRVRRVRHEHLAGALAAWTADDVAALGALLDRLVDDLQANPLA